jgi:hypothetical protein
MKNLVLFISALLIITCLFSCKKTNEGVGTSIKTNFKGVVPLQGEWAVMSDSLVTGVGAIVNGKKYTGENGDYYNFSADNKLYVKEAASLDTFTYKMLTDTTLSIVPVRDSARAIPFACFIKPLTTSSVVMTWTPSLSNPGSFYSRTVVLFK